MQSFFVSESESVSDSTLVKSDTDSDADSDTKKTKYCKLFFRMAKVWIL